jgi:hypothetical protein
MRNKQRSRDLVVISGNKWFKTLWKGALRDVEPFFIGGGKRRIMKWEKILGFV